MTFIWGTCVPRVKTRRNSAGGFTLIELSIVLMLGGVAFAATATAAKQYMQRERVVQMKKTVDTAMSGIEKYFIEYGRYPCPARLDTGLGNPQSGQATDCNDTASVAVGTCGNGYCVTSRTVDHDNNPGTAAVAMRIRIGALPFRQLNEGTDTVPGATLYQFPYPISNANTLDPFGNKLFYAITERQAIGDHLEYAGAIEIRNESGTVIDGAADYVLFSPGRNRKGAYNATGALSSEACAGAGIDVENCDMDAVFVDALRSDVEGASYYDDTIAYSTGFSVPLWEISSSDQTDIHNINAGRVGINTFSPTEKLEIADGDVRAQNLLRSPNLCDEAGANCMSPDIIGGCDPLLPGDCSPGEPQAMGRCPPGQVMQGMGNNTSACVVTVSADEDESCPERFYLAGFNFDSASRSLASTCAGLPCELPWGGTIAHGQSIQTYDGYSCTPTTRTCNTGTLEGDINFPNQNPPPRCLRCDVGAPWHVRIAMGESITNAWLVCPSGEQETRVCQYGGTLSGSAALDYAPVCPCSLPWGGTINPLESVTAWRSCENGDPLHPPSTTRTCSATRSILSGDGYNNQTEPTCGCNLPWGGSIQVGQSATGWRACPDADSTSRDCVSHGNLTGGAAYNLGSSPAPCPPPPPPPPPPGP